MQLREGKLGLACRSVQAHADNSKAVNVRNGQIYVFALGNNLVGYFSDKRGHEWKRYSG